MAVAERQFKRRPGRYSIQGINYYKNECRIFDWLLGLSIWDYRLQKYKFDQVFSLHMLWCGKPVTKIG
jgi:hypothetical protein